jgi:hypothetical protein
MTPPTHTHSSRRTHPALNGHRGIHSTSYIAQGLQLLVRGANARHSLDRLGGKHPSTLLAEGGDGPAGLATPHLVLQVSAGREGRWAGGRKRDRRGWGQCKRGERAGGREGHTRLGGVPKLRPQATVMDKLASRSPCGGYPANTNQRLNGDCADQACPLRLEAVVHPSGQPSPHTALRRHNVCPVPLLTAQKGREPAATTQCCGSGCRKPEPGVLCRDGGKPA